MWVPVLLPDPKLSRDPWHDALLELASRFRGPGADPTASNAPDPTLQERRVLRAHLERLASAFAGPRRIAIADGLARAAVCDERQGLRLRRWEQTSRSSAAAESLLWSLTAVVPARFPRSA